MMMDHMGGMIVWMLLWGLIGLALLTLIITSIVWLINHMSTSPTPRTDPAEEELRRRYAAGDLDDEEYHRRRDELRKR